MLSQFDQMQAMMKKMQKGGLAKMMRGMKGMMPGGDAVGCRAVADDRRMHPPCPTGSAASLTAPRRHGPVPDRLAQALVRQARSPSCKPATTEEVAAVVTLCAANARADRAAGRQHRPVRRRATPDASGRAVVLSLSRHEPHPRDRPAQQHDDGRGRLRARDAAAGRGRAPTGCSRCRLAAEGSCQIGGNLSTNAGGVQVLRYGNARELVPRARGGAADGRGLGRPARPAQGQHRLRPEAALHRRRGHARRDHRGGAEAVSEAAPRRSTALVALAIAARTRSRCSRSRSRALGDRHSPRSSWCPTSACELVRKHFPELPAPLAGRIPWYVLLEIVATPRARRVRRRFEALLERGARARARRATRRSRERARRRGSSGSCARTSRRRRRSRARTSSTTSRCRSRAIAEFIDATDAALERAFPACGMVVFGHLGDGNLHYNVSPPRRRRPATRFSRRGRRSTASCTTRSPRSAARSRPSTASASAEARRAAALQVAGRAGADARDQAGARSARDHESGQADRLRGAETRPIRGRARRSRRCCVRTTVAVSRIRHRAVDSDPDSPPSLHVPSPRLPRRADLPVRARRAARPFADRAVADRDRGEDGHPGRRRRHRLVRAIAPSPASTATRAPPGPTTICARCAGRSAPACSSRTCAPPPAPTPRAPTATRSPSADGSSCTTARSAATGGSAAASRR